MYKVTSPDLSEPLDLSRGVIIVLSGGPFDWMNPIEVRTRMDQIITDINADPWVLESTDGKGLIFRLLENQQANHIHQARWKDLLDNTQLLAASPLIIVGHSNGGAAAMDLARYLQDQGRSVDFMFTADSVHTLNDNGDPYTLPSNVKINLNSYSIPVFPIWSTLPFPFGQKNHRQEDGSLDGIMNIGLEFAEPGAAEHRDVFYALAGGDQTGDGYKYPELIRDSALRVLKGASKEEIFGLATAYLQNLSNEARIPISLEDADTTEMLYPVGTAAPASKPQSQDSSIAGLQRQMIELERTRLAMR